MPEDQLFDTGDTARRLAWAPPESISTETVADALRDQGARPWQVEATAERIAAAFVQAARPDDDEPRDPE